ncbi:MAG: NAD(P)/FAD-dependent oxidoreductase [Candidatus Moraniibacteriota bacterium]
MHTYDVVVIGGGPAGMMAAGRAAECGARVVLLEKNASLGKKLLITGGGRCNVTNAEFDTNVFLAKFKDAAKFLFSPFSQLDVQGTLEFFHSHGMSTKVEAENRVFPVSDSAQSVWDVLVAYMRSSGVCVMSDAEVTGFEINEGRISGVQLRNGRVLRAKSYVLATGGKSHPETGSTGDGFRFLRELGHTIVEPRSALVPIRLGDPWVRSLSGVSLEGVKVTVFLNGKKIETQEGKLLFTHFGVSGPLALNMSQTVGKCLHRGEVVLSMDLFPHSNSDEIDRRVQELFENQKNKQVKNSLDGFLAPLLIPVILRLATIPLETPVHSVSRVSRLALVRIVKDLRLIVSGLLGEDRAVVTSGGVALEEVDFKTMRSRLYPNFHLVGDILNINRPSGGYSLQLCWTTGFVAGGAAAGNSKE